MSKVKGLSELLRERMEEQLTDHAPRMFGEVFDDGQFRGHYKIDDVPRHAMVIGDYLLWPLDGGEEIGMGFRPTGEMGIFKTADFEPYLKAFFGLNF
jgi:hypothetical protein